MFIPIFLLLFYFLLSFSSISSLICFPLTLFCFLFISAPKLTLPLSCFLFLPFFPPSKFSVILSSLAFFLFSNYSSSSYKFSLSFFSFSFLFFCSPFLRLPTLWLIMYLLCLFTLRSLYSSIYNCLFCGGFCFLSCFFLALYPHHTLMPNISPHRSWCLFPPRSLFFLSLFTTLFLSSFFAFFFLLLRFCQASWKQNIKNHLKIDESVNNSSIDTSPSHLKKFKVLSKDSLVNRKKNLAEERRLL